jgi:hypothetical protein
MSSRSPAKRIPKSISTDTKLFGTYTLTDIAVALLPGVVVILLTQLLLPESLSIGGYALRTLTLPIAAGAIALGALFVYLTPAYASSLDWIETFARFQQSEREITHETAKQYTQIERVHQERGAIERQDGALLGLVQVDPPTMALATDEEWAEKADAFQDFCNTAVEFPMQIYSTTQQFPADEYLARYERRLNDPDVKENPRLAALIEHYTEWYRAELDERRMTIRDHYVIVPVTPQEVQFDRDSLAQQLADIPLVGLFVQAWLAPPLDEQRQAMFEALTERRQRVETGLRDIDGCDARRVDADEAARLVGEFWAGDSREYDDLRQALRTTPLVGTGGTT